MGDLVICKKCNQHVLRDELSMKKHLVGFHDTIPTAPKKKRGMEVMHVIISISGTFFLMKMLHDQFRMVGVATFLTGMFWGCGLLVLGILSWRARDPLLDHFDKLEASDE